MEALPSSSAAIVACQAVPLLCAKLLSIEYIDLAEQALQVSYRLLLGENRFLAIDEHSPL